MIGFDYPVGLLLLSAIPILLLLMRLRTIPRRKVFTAFFLLARMKKPSPIKTLRLFLLKRTERMALSCLVIFCLAMAVSGAFWGFGKPVPERWLFVVDNTSLSLREFEGVPVLNDMRRAVLNVSDRLYKEDAVSILTTSPRVRLATFSPGAGLRAFMRSLSVSADFPSVQAILGELRQMTGYHSRIIVLSPRSAAWRSALAESGLGASITVPPDGRTASGNAGLTHLRLTPNQEAPGSYDIFIGALAVGTAPDRLPLLIRNNGRTMSAPASLALVRGRGKLLVEKISLEAGMVSVAIPVEDAFALDNSATARLPEEKPVAVSRQGETSPILDAAVGAYEDFKLQAAGGDVNVCLGDPPGEIDRPSLVINPSLDRFGLVFQELMETSGDVIWHPDHPITASLRSRSFRPGKVASFTSEGYQSLAVINGVPIVLAGSHGGQRIVVWTFNPLERGLFLRPEFIILLRESIAWLAGYRDFGVTPALSLAQTAGALTVASPAFRAPEAPRLKERSGRLDLVPFFLFLALLAGLFLGLADTVPIEEVRE